MTAYEPAGWSELFVASAGSAAALTGLVFVAVSINIERIVREQGLPERALAILVVLLALVVVSLTGLAPGQSRVALGAELLGIGLLAATATIRLITRQETNGKRSRRQLIGNLVVMAAGTLPFAVGGASVMLGAGGGLYWVLGGMVFALFGAIVNAWVLLVEILR